jgi:hypothetical protein
MSVPFRIWPECFRAAKMMASWILVMILDIPSGYGKRL